MSNTIPDLFPSHMGTEEETMLMFGRSLMSVNAPIHFLDMHDSCLPDTVKHINNEGKYYLQNGSVVYDGSHESYERATPECIDPYQTTQYTLANEKLLVDVLSNYVASSSECGDPLLARVHRRVVDSYGNSKACHDNFSLASAVLDPNSPRWDENHSALITQLATRSPITGAGHVTETGFYTAQKAPTVVSLDTYNFVSSVYRLATEDYEDTGPRLEIRCSDINISPWANQVRLGSMSLLLATLQTPLARAIDTITHPILTEGGAVHTVRNGAALIIDENANIRPSDETMRSIDFQEQLAELYADKLDQFCDLPDSLRRIAHEIIYYCQDFRKVASSEEEIGLIANRSDYAAKLRIIQRSLTRDRAIGIARTPFDYKSQMHDMKYDMITVEPGEDLHGKSTIRTNYGSGYTLRDNGSFAMPIKPVDIDRAYYLPPEESRAYTRGTLIRKGLASNDTDWQTMGFRDGVISSQQIILEPDIGTKDSGVLEFIENMAIPVEDYPVQEFEEVSEEAIVGALGRSATAITIFIPPQQ